MKDQRLQILDIVSHIDDATQGTLNVPEFQRRFVWSPFKVARLVESLWREYPVGTLLLWDSKNYDSPRTALGDQSRTLWIVDGQQRVTALALVFGKKPYWWEDANEWNTDYRRCDVLVDIAKEKDALDFALPNPVRAKSKEWISVRRILTCKSLAELTEEICVKLGDPEKKRFSEVFEKLDSIKKIERAPLYEIIIDHELEDVAEIFNRLNSAGTKILQSDIIIALLAAKQRGWIRDTFNPFLKDLELKGFGFDPGIIVRSLAIIGHESAKLGAVRREFWEPSAEFDKNWGKTKEAIAAVIRNLMEYGVLSSILLPSHNALIPVFVLRATFPKEFKFKKALHWLLIATRAGRYSGSAITALNQDTRLIREKKSFGEAIDDLTKGLSATGAFTAEDFREDYSDRFLRLVFYLTVFNTQARDWREQTVRVGFDKKDNALNEGFKPEWHHFFPRKILTKKDPSLTDSIANIVVLNEKANRSFSGNPPQKYLAEHGVERARLDEQGIPADEYLVLERFEEFLDLRAEKLAAMATAFLDGLSK